MQADIEKKRDALAALCRQYGVARLEVFGSAARDAGFDPNRSDADFLVTFNHSARNDLTAFTDLKDALERLLGRPVDLVEREAIEMSRNFIRRRAIPKPSMAELPERDAALLLDMLLAARDALSFVEGLDEATFLASRLHQNAAIRSLEVLGEVAGKVSAVVTAAHPEIPWRAKSRACVSILSG